VNVADLVGSWDLLSFDVTAAGGGEPSYWLGQDAIGRLTYGADGSMSVFLSARERTPVPWRGAPAEAAAGAYSTFLAYAGSFQLNGATVTHHIEFTSVPGYPDQVREASFEDGNLVLIYRSAAGQVARLLWRRR
jgi:hypothetical protein